MIGKKKKMPKMKDQRYLYAKDKFFEYYFQALKNHFSNKEDFTSFFKAIENDDQKNLFLKTASFYLFLVKKGDWFVDIDGSDKRVDYLTDTYKYIAIFSLIESLQEREFMDFYSFLVRRKNNVKPTIENLSKYLYNLRSKFLHEAELIVNISGRKTISRYGKEVVICKLSIKNLM